MHTLTYTCAHAHAKFIRKEGVNGVCVCVSLCVSVCLCLCVSVFLWVFLCTDNVCTLQQSKQRAGSMTLWFRYDLGFNRRSRYGLGFNRTDAALVLGVLCVDESDVVVEVVPVCMAEP